MLGFLTARVEEQNPTATRRLRPLVAVGLLLAGALAMPACGGQVEKVPPSSAAACTVVGGWSIKSGASPLEGLFTALDITEYNGALLVDHDDRVNAVLLGEWTEGKLRVVLQKDLSGVDKGAPSTPKLSDKPPPPPDPKGPRAKPPTSMRSGVRTLRDPMSYVCTPSPTCGELACNTDRGHAFTLTKR